MFDGLRSYGPVKSGLIEGGLFVGPVFDLVQKYVLAPAKPARQPEAEFTLQVILCGFIPASQGADTQLIDPSKAMQPGRRFVQFCNVVDCLLPTDEVLCQVNHAQNSAFRSATSFKGSSTQYGNNLFL